MNNPSFAVEVLRGLRPTSAVTTPDGVGIVLAQLRDKVTVLGFDGVVRVYDRFRVEPKAER